MTSHFPQVAHGSLKRRKRLSLKEQTEAAPCLQNGASASSVMKRFGIGVRALRGRASVHGSRQLLICEMLLRSKEQNGHPVRDS